MHVYCLFCQTQHCTSIARMAAQQFACQAITPRIVQRKWVKGQPQEETHDYLPGYVFLYSEAPLNDLAELRRIHGVIRCLSDTSRCYELYGSDLSFAEMLLRCDGTIGILKAYEEGSTVRLCDDLFTGFEGTIVKLDRQRGRAKVRFEFEHATREMWVGYEVMERVETQ